MEGLPIINLYAQQYGTTLAWDLSQLSATTDADVRFLAETKYVLIPAYIYNYLPAESPMRSIVAEHWNVIWSYKADHVWGTPALRKPSRYCTLMFRFRVQKFVRTSTLNEVARGAGQGLRPRGSPDHPG